MVRKQQSSGFPVLSTVTIVCWAVALLLAAAVAVVLALAVQPDVGQTVVSVVGGIGGAVALLLSVRKQRSTELDLRQQEHDASERRVTELYGSAADQLGSDKATVRSAGLFALERLAQDNSAHRQTIVNLICAYLRMPFEPAPGSSEELQVRLIAQQLLATHLRPDESGDKFWPGIELNLSGATLVQFALTNCTAKSVFCNEARFVGAAIFRGATIQHSTDFRRVQFSGLADFRRVRFGDDARGFRHAVFEGEVDFGTTTTVNLTGARATADCTQRRKWPAGWIERESTDDPTMKHLVIASSVL